ncbi:hypothetical protein BDB00DRAFT_867061 [Zychaea mexicana]|uniref:uncharacterized protein n=1 Tax=Zychaea mexicana TaxID=64656 RepID=UPI0022FF17BD|nr:uncharacterized protein BDB00DRAFT_867061 [Zychaea mexicana]KAI9498992.1 hypothetical protein BDB00DRAFT_867061 [Zychaea mexicana]
MPDTLPATLFVKQFYIKLVFLACTAARAAIVSSVWLLVLPYLTVWTWRFYLWSGENLAHRLSRFQSISIINATNTATTTITATATATAKAAFSSSSTTSSTVASLISSSASSSSSPSSSSLSPITSDASSATITAAAQDLFHDAHQSITTVFPHSANIEKLLESFNSKAFLADCFEGQVITCIVVIAFVAAFLLREWIIQNIPAELEDDEDEDERVETMDETIQLDELDEQQYHQLQQQQQQQQQQQHDAPTDEALDRRREAIYELQQNELYQQNDHRDDDNLDQQQQNGNSGVDEVMDVDDPYPKPSSSASSSSDTRRSMEPGYSHSSEGETSDTEEAAATPNVARGEPPNAPIMRHVDHHFDIRAAGHRRALLFEEQVNDNDMLLPAPADDDHHHRHHHHNEPPPPQQQQPNNNVINNNNDPPAAENDDNDVDEDNFGDDIDGILEAIGMHGNYVSLAQNSALMSLLISLCLGAAVWIPYVVGIIFIMATPFEAANSLLWLVRKVTDPLLDTVFTICTSYLWPCVSSFIQSQERSFNRLGQHEATAYIYEAIANGVTKAQRLIQQVYPFDSTVVTTTAATSSSTIATGSNALSDGGIQIALSKLFSATAAKIPTNWSDTQIAMNQLIDQHIKPAAHDALIRYHGFATGHSAFDRFVCIIIGYAVIITGSSWYLSRAHVAYATFGRSARQVVQQQGIILKVAMFIAIELLLFPIVCGILMDVSSLSLFRDATVDSRLAYLQSHPLASVFLHWFLGTSFMFFFAILVTVCREIVRPGVLWFIRDPNDPQFHPIKEIVERPVLTQLQKIGASGITYACVIVAGVGGFVWCLGYAGKGILPLRWNMLQPLSTLPIDFLAIHILIPALVKYFEPKRALKTLAVQWMRFLTRTLRLTSFLFGERHASEEGVWHYKTWAAWLHPPANLNPLVGEYSEAAFIRDGQIVLAPKHDAVPFDPTRRMLVPVHPETLHILDATERRLGHPAAAGGPNLLPINTCIVYVPPRFKQRMILFLLAMWLSCSVFICTLTVLPIALGRIVFERWLEAPGEVHDLYAYSVGATLMLLGIVSICKLADAVLDLTRQASSSLLLGRIYYYVSGSLRWMGKVTYLGVALGIIVPLMLGAVVELYFIMPLQNYGAQAPTVEVVALWTRGIACMSTMHGVIHLGPENPWRDHVNMIFQPDVRAINIREITTKFITPIIAATLLMTVLPFSMALANIKLLGEEDLGRQIRMIQIMYPAALAGAGVYCLCRVGAKFGQTWVQTVREDNYLVGRTLHNFDN